MPFLATITFKRTVLLLKIHAMMLLSISSITILKKKIKKLEDELNKKIK